MLWLNPFILKRDADDRLLEKENEDRVFDNRLLAANFVHFPGSLALEI
jgi:hypothetical protein